MPKKMCICGRPIEIDGARECETCAENERMYVEYYLDDVPRQSSQQTEPIRQQPKSWRGPDRRNGGA